MPSRASQGIGCPPVISSQRASSLRQHLRTTIRSEQTEALKLKMYELKNAKSGVPKSRVIMIATPGALPRDLASNRPSTVTGRHMAMR